MTLAAVCKEELKKFECACQNNSINFETIQHALDSLFLVKSELPNELQFLELLDAFADHFATSCDESVRQMAFHLLFPCGFNVNPVRERFLISLTELAICVGLAPLLDLVAVWLKGQIFIICQSISTKDCVLSTERLFEATRPVSNFVRKIFESLLTVRGMQEVCRNLLENGNFSDVSVFEKPFINLLRLSPPLVSALVSGATLVYSAPFLQDEPEFHPPPMVVEILIIWLKWSHSQSVRQDWASFDWKAYFSVNPPRFLDKPKVKGQDWPLLLSEAWHPVRGLVWLTLLSSNCKNLSESVASLTSEMHCILLENFSVPLNRAKLIRGSSGIVSDLQPIMWRLKFPSEVETLLKRFGTAKSKLSDLCLIRICELISISWRSERLLECNSGGISKALKPFSSERIVQVTQHCLGI
ncbi:unnamed protein product [Hymenolepis diminuta]|uniref:Uncharacterized protein n=1 Tax=Hymenolepis diminuta TaxID=6216 RepID=A0A564YVX0_HYMDI|nr:unnamed protein product [Hymenolepis diminuta]